MEEIDPELRKMIETTLDFARMIAKGYLGLSMEPEYSQFYPPRKPAPRDPSSP